jgi:nucleoside-diphosphate-sugar epimerase
LFGPDPIFRDWDLIKYGRRGQLDISKAKHLLGYAPRIPRAEGMRQIERWLRDQNLI